MTPSGFRRRPRVRPDELAGLEVETLLVWGRDEPLGAPDVAERTVHLVPDARLEVVPGGHAPWLDEPEAIARTVTTFVSDGHRPSPALG